MERFRLRKTEGMIIVVLLLFIILSMTSLSRVFSSPDLYVNTLQTIEKQKQEIVGLNIAVTTASTLLSTLPDDIGSAISGELADLTFPLFLILCVLYIEKFLLTTFGWISFFVLFPVAAILGILWTIFKIDQLCVWIKKTVILGLALVLIIPFSAFVTRQIEITFEESISQTLHAAQHVTDSTKPDSDEEGNAFIEFFTGLKDNVVSLADTAKDLMNIMIDAVAVLLIICCVIPAVTALFFIWMIKSLMDINVSVSYAGMNFVPSKMRRAWVKNSVNIKKDYVELNEQGKRRKSRKKNDMNS